MMLAILFFLTSIAFLELENYPLEIRVNPCSTPKAMTSILEVKLTEKMLPGATFELTLKLSSDLPLEFLKFELNEKAAQDWELLPLSQGLVTSNKGPDKLNLPFVLRAKKKGELEPPRLEAVVLLNLKPEVLVWENWLTPPDLFPFKELDTTSKLKISNPSFFNPTRLGLTILLLIAGGVWALVKTRSKNPPKPNLKEELELWLITNRNNAIKKVATEENIIKVATLIRGLKAEGLQIETIEWLDKAISECEKIRFSNDKDSHLLTEIIEKIIKTL